MNLHLLIIFIILYSSINAESRCGFEDDLGVCMKYKNCPLEKRKNLTFASESSGNAYKYVKHCLKFSDVCCDARPTSTVVPMPVGDCPGKCLSECPPGWNEKTPPTPAPSPNYGAGLIESKSLLGTLCFKRRTICCELPPETRRIRLCGERNLSTSSGMHARIRFGVNADFMEFPWVVAIMKKEPYRGTQTAHVFKSIGSLITRKIILTAAHKVQDVHNPSTLVVYAGDYDISQRNEPLPHQEGQVASVIIHEHFDRLTHINNVALLVLREPLVFTESVGVICLPKPGDLDFGAKCVVAGWGRNDTDDNRSARYQSVLKKIQLNLVQHEECQNRLRNTRLGSDFVLHDSFVCALGENGTDTCRGDGGAPLACPLKSDSSRYFQMGITSWGIGCGTQYLPGVYVNIMKYSTWIQEEINSLASPFEEK